MKLLKGMNLNQCAMDYVTCLDKAPNAWGQNYSNKAQMVSHYWLISICQFFGKYKALAAIDAAFLLKNDAKDINKICRLAVAECATLDNAKTYHLTTDKFVFALECIEHSDAFILAGEAYCLTRFNMTDNPALCERFTEQLENRFDKLIEKHLKEGALL